MSGERLGKYELVHHLASGGMASVFLARVSGLGGFERHVVLKTLKAGGDESLIAMFLDEARLLATLHHQHIAQVFEVGYVDDTYFLAMEYIHGETVRAVLETAVGRAHWIPFDVGLSVGVAAAAGLHHAHEQCASDGTPLNIVHRDVSPSNVILGFDGTIKLIDFGIAKADARTAETQTGFIKGKAGYMAPEQVLGYDVDRRTDVFSLGVLVYELTTQHRAFAADSQYESTHRVVHGELVPPSRVVPGYPIELEDVVMTALELDPDDRFQDANAMRTALVQVALDLKATLGNAPIMRILDELYGTRREPWLAPSKRRPTSPTVRAQTVPPPIPAGLAPVRATTAPLASAPRPPAPAGITAAPRPAPPSGIAPEPRPAGPSSIGPAPRTAPLPAPVVAPMPPAAAPPTLAVGSGEHDPPVVHTDDNATTHRFHTLEPDTVTVTPSPSGLTPLPLPTPPIPMTALLGPAAPPSAADSGDAWPTPIVLPSRVDIQSADRGSSVIRLSRRLMIAVGSLGLATGVGLAFVMLSSSGEAKQQPAPVPPHPAPAYRPAPPAPPRPPPPPPPVAADHVTLHVTSEPDGASVVLDGVKLGATPFTGTVPTKPGTATLKVRLAKHKPQRITVTLDHDIDWSPTLPDAP